MGMAQVHNKRQLAAYAVTWQATLDTDREWPDCPVDGCENKICLALASDKCFPHTVDRHTKKIIEDLDVVESAKEPALIDVK